MKSTFQIALVLTILGCLAFGTGLALADTPATTAVYRATDSAVSATPVGHYRPYRGYYRAPNRPYAAYNPYYAYRPYVYQPYVAGAYGYGYPYSVRSPYSVGYRYPSARARGYDARPRARAYFRYGY